MLGFFCWFVVFLGVVRAWKLRASLFCRDLCDWVFHLCSPPILCYASVVCAECFFHLTPSQLSFNKGNKYNPGDKSMAHLKLSTLTLYNIEVASESKDSKKDSSKIGGKSGAGVGAKDAGADVNAEADIRNLHGLTTITPARSVSLSVSLYAAPLRCLLFVVICCCCFVPRC